MKINGYDVLKSKRAWQQYCRKEWFCGEPEPKHYPCIVESRLGSDENPYLEYTYLSDVEKMRNALIKVHGENH